MNVGIKSSCCEKNEAMSRRAIRAFSLIEVIVACAIVAIIFSALFTGTTATFNLEGSTRENLRATQIVVSRLEGLRLCAWSNDQLFNTNVVPKTFTDWFYPLGLKSSTNNGTSYTGTITVTTNFSLNPPATYANKLALVTVTVSWTNAQENTSSHTRSMSTFVARYGVQNYVFGH
jgi:prepilin-type N-terminal cleavage/methylation domain-containing protein